MRRAEATLIFIYILAIILAAPTLVAQTAPAVLPTTGGSTGLPVRPLVGTVGGLSTPVLGVGLVQSPLNLTSGYCPAGYCTAWGGTCPQGASVAYCISAVKTAAAYAGTNCTYGNVSCLMQYQAIGCPPGIMGQQCMQNYYQQQMAWQQYVQQQQQRQAAQDALLTAAAASMVGKMLGGGGMGSASRSSTQYDNGGRRSELAGGGSDDTFSHGNGIMSNKRWISVDDLSSDIPILAITKTFLPKCFEKLGLSDCKFISLGTDGDPATHPLSCHNDGHAFDIGAFDCKPKGLITPREPQALGLKPTNTDIFSEIAHCMADDPATEGKFGVIYNNELGSKGTHMETSRENHTDHMHLETYGCKKAPHT